MTVDFRRRAKGSRSGGGACELCAKFRVATDIQAGAGRLARCRVGGCAPWEQNHSYADPGRDASAGRTATETIRDARQAARRVAALDEGRIGTVITPMRLS